VVLVFSQRSGWRKVAQQSVHLTLGILRTSQAFFYASAFFQSDGFAVPAPAQVTQSVGWLTPKSKSKTVFESQVWFLVWLKKQIRLLGLVIF
jgi:hypothetical protein